MGNRPSAEALEAAVGRTVPDVIADDLRVLFCGINPGLWSGALGHHFAHPGNRFWKALQAAGFTAELLSPADEGRLLAHGLGVTNIVPLTTRTAAELSPAQLRAGAAELAAKVARRRPRALAVLGLTAYRAGFARRHARIGEQEERLAGARVFVLPNPSGLQATYPFGRLVAELAALRVAVDGP